MTNTELHGPEVRIFRGLPGSGKSTAAKQMVAENPDTMLRVSRDDIREMLLGPDYPRPNNEFEQLVTVIEHAAIVAGIKADKIVIVDSMHLRPQYIRNIYKLVPLDVPITFYEYEVDVETAVFRDAQRASAGGREVGGDVIRDIARRFMPKGQFMPAPDRYEEFHVFRPYTPRPDAIPAIIVDVDGTLAHIDSTNPRSPYDATRANEDHHDEVVADLVERMSAEHHVIIVTGRSEQYREVTEAWLAAHNIHYDRLYMRADGDERNDAIVKDEIFENNIRDHFKIQFVLDDRDRVVNMWRQKGIKCLQVAPGNF